MRLVAWNANYNRYRRSLEADVELLRDFDADVIVLSETAPPSEGNPLGASFVGTAAPGLAVVTRELHIPLHPAPAEPPTLSAAFTLPGGLSLLALWPVARSGNTYHSILMSALDCYGDVLAGGPAIIAGDLNSSSRVVSQQRTHPKFVAAAERLHLVSAYHSLSGEDFGEESLNTYCHSSGPVRDFHIDYCFISRELLPRVRFEVQTDAVWMTRSDHYPIVLDIEES